jgi:hypothetical protein
MPSCSPTSKMVTMFGMRQAPGRARLADEALAHLFHDLARQVRQQRLDRDFAVDERVERAVDGAHRSPPQLAHDAVTAQRFQVHRSFRSLIYGLSPF